MELTNHGLLPPFLYKLNDKEIRSGQVVYWMSRDQRVADNAALYFAQQQALLLKQPLVVVFNLYAPYLDAPFRHYHFMTEGLKEVEQDLSQLNITMVVLQGEPHQTIPSFLKMISAGLLVTDFNPLRINRSWKDKVAKNISVSFIEADAHNIVPCRHASVKQEYGAYTLRPKINRLLADFLHEPPALIAHPYSPEIPFNKIDWQSIVTDIKCNRSPGPVTHIKSGSCAAFQILSSFISERLANYETRNDPNNDVLSECSPYLHFGQISALRIAIEVKKAAAPASAKESFLEELIIRRELSDNFCLYNEHYDSFDGLPNWARETLNAHRNDEREHIYTAIEFENAATHDELWNAAQKQMEKTGKMHGYMRMYWAKKILEWSSSPEEAIATAIYLNDKYSLDGRDPNGYAGILWSIGGLHDRPWFNRPVYGKIRYMSYNGCKTKFDIHKYILSNT